MIKNISIILLIATFISSQTLMADEKLPPYLKVTVSSSQMDELIMNVSSALETEGFEVLGQYNPGTNKNLAVLAYTRKDLQQLSLKVEDRGALASVLKIGFVQKSEQITVSMLNPMYLFYAYFMDEADKMKADLSRITSDAKSAMKTIGNDFTGFGGGLEVDDLKDYHYMMMMPYFTDPVELKEFSSFNEGLKTIRENLQAKKGNTVQVYELVFEDKQVAIFGVGLLDAEDGEAHFLPIIGEDNIAAMPYEIILQGKEASMLHGKYRFALHWPELSMKQFMKISSTPGDVEDMLKGLTE